MDCWIASMKSTATQALLMKKAALESYLIMILPRPLIPATIALLTCARSALDYHLHTKVMLYDFLGVVLLA